MIKFNKVTIIGVGLIGGSIGLAIKKRGLAKEVVGVFRRESTLKKALKCKAVDKGFMNIKDGVKDADLIVLSSYVASIPLIAIDAIRYAKAGAVITDAGSTKGWIVESIENTAKSFGHVDFVGSHPMAGSDHAGVEFAKADLFDGAPCIVTKTAGTSAAALNKITKLWSSLGAKVNVLSPSQHDKSVSLVSHLPHVVAFSLAGAVPEKELKYAAEGFKDTTRVASSDPELWADTFLSNKKELLAACKMFEKYYKDIMKAVSSDDKAKLLKILAKAKAKRDKFIYGKSAA